LSEDSISTKLREFCKNKFPTLESIPKDAEARNNLYREFCKTDNSVHPRKHLGIFYTMLEEHIKKNLHGNPDDFVKRIAPKTKQTMQLKTSVSLNPKNDASKPDPQKQSSQQTTTTPPATAQPTAQLQPSGSLMTVEQKRAMAAYPFKAVNTIMKLYCDEIQDLTKDQEDALADAYYPILAPYIENGKLLQWVFAGSVTIAVFGSKARTIKNYSQKKKLLKKEETQKTDKEKPEPEQIEKQNTSPALFKEPTNKKIGAKDKDAMIKELVEKTNMDEDKVREMFKDV